MQRQARALGDPSRHQIFQYVAAAHGPVGVTAIAAHLRLHHTAIRQHLAKLCDAKLLVRSVDAQKQWGRPAYLYRPAPGVAGLWGTSSPHEQLAMLLLEVMRSGGHPRAVGVAAGQQAAQAAAPGADPVEVLEAEVARRGFETRREQHAGGDVDIVFPACPYDAAAAMAPEVVCELHRGLAEGVLSEMGGDFVVSGLVIRGNVDGSCRLQLHRRRP